MLWGWLGKGYLYSEILSQFSLEYGLTTSQAQTDFDAILAAWQDGLLSPETQLPASDQSSCTPPTTFHAAKDFRVNNRRIRLFVGDSELAEEVFPRLDSLQGPQCGAPDSQFQVWREGGQTRLAEGGKVIASEENPNAARAILLQEMVRGSEPAKEWLGILHAGACGNDNSCVLLAGSSHSGKTTLCAALMASGFRFYCDDSAGIDDKDRSVSPMPFKMMVREGSWNVLASRFPELLASLVFERCGQRVRYLNPGAGQAAIAPAPAKALLFVSFVPGERTLIRPVLPFETLLGLQKSGFWVRHDRQSISSFLDWLQSLPAYALTYSDLEEAVSAVRAMCEPADSGGPG